MTDLEDSLSVYQDDSLLIIDKPAGIPTISSKDHPLSLTTLVRNTEKFASPCHRLDMNTSGLVIFGKTHESLQDITLMMKNRNIDKFYIALVKGYIPKDEHGAIDLPLLYDKGKNITRTGNNGKPAYTEYLSLANKKDVSLLLIKIGTGRTHQIRAHLSDLGNPVLGDMKYGTNSSDRLYLHSCLT